MKETETKKIIAEEILNRMNDQGAANVLRDILNNNDNKIDWDKALDKLAEKDNFTNDKQYNHGLKLIRENGYNYVCGEPDVKYYCMCNGY